MARSIRSPKLETRTSRLRLPVAKKPAFTKIDRGLALGYRRNAGPGTWVMRVTRDGQDWTDKVAIADDHEEADGGRVLTFWQAQARARELALGQHETNTATDRPVTVSDAIDAYQIDLQARGGEIANAQRCRVHLPASLAGKAVALLTAKELRHFRDSLLKQGLAAPTVKRTCKALAAAFSLAARHDPRIQNRDAWRTGMGSLRDADVVRNVILRETEVRTIVDAAWAIDPAFGLFVEVAATTGARVSQLRGLNVEDLQDDTAAPKLAMPTSKKGRGTKRVSHYVVPIPVSLASKLRSNRPGQEPLLLRHGVRWRRSDHWHPFRAAVARAKLDPTKVTIYALRHSSIVRQLLAGVPIRLVANGHNTGTAMVERSYSRFIGDHSDALIRAAMLDLGAAPTTGRAKPISAERRG